MARRRSRASRHPVAPAALGRIERHIGTTEQIDAVLASAQLSDANAHGKGHCAVGRVDRRRRDQRPDPFGNLKRRPKRSTDQQNGELFSADTSDDVDIAQALSAQLGEPANHKVPDRMAISVVDPLEMVDIEDQQRQRLRQSLRAGSFLFENANKMTPVADTTQGVGVRQAFELLFEPVAFLVFDRENRL